jgi:hypothetical protein
MFHIRLYADVPTIFFPMMWFEERATMTPDLASSLRLLLMLPVMGLYSSLGLVCLGMVIVAIQVLPRILKSEKWTLPRRSKRYAQGDIQSVSKRALQLWKPI